MLAYLLLRAIIFVSGTEKCISSDRREYFIDVVELKKFKTKCSFLLLFCLFKLFDLILADTSDEKFVSNH